jgi:hypothetical protein
MRPTRRLHLAAALGAFLGTAVLPASADTIVLLSGERIEGVDVENDGLKEVSFKRGRDTESRPSDQVLSIKFSEKPEKLQEAEAALEQNDVEEALYQLDLYIEGHLSGSPERRHKWAPAQAAWQIVELHRVDGRSGEVVGADRLISQFPESRWVPYAYLTKARAQAQSGNTEAALATYRALSEFAQGQSLSNRWALESRLGQLRTSDVVDDQRIDQIERLKREAQAEFPLVAKRAQLAVGEGLMFMADRAEGSKRADLIVRATEQFEPLAEGSGSDSAILAGALTGLGEVEFLKASNSGDAEGLDRARMNFLRVVVLHGEEVDYVPKAMFYAGLCCKQLGELNSDENELSRARKLGLRLRREFKDSIWADQAASALR